MNEYTKELFLAECENILGVKQEVGETIGRGRWRRGAGNGRFIGYGLVRWFSSDLIQLSLTKPDLKGIYKNPEDALKALKDALS